MIPYWYTITLESSICTKSCFTLQGLVCLETVSSIASFLLLVEWGLDQLWLCGFCLFRWTMRYVSVGLKKIPSFLGCCVQFMVFVLFYNFGMIFFLPCFFIFIFFTPRGTASCVFYSGYKFLGTLVAACPAGMLGVVAGCMRSVTSCLGENSSLCWPVKCSGSGFECWMRSCLKQSTIPLKRVWLSCLGFFSPLTGLVRNNKRWAVGMCKLTSALWRRKHDSFYCSVPKRAHQ